MELIIKKDIEALSRELAGWMIGHIHKILEEKEFFSLVLSGGGTPEKLYRLLASAGFRERIPWERIRFFWGDERAVDFSDKRNNAAMAFDNLLSHVPVNVSQVFKIATAGEPSECAAAYEKTLRNFFPDPKQSFDLVLLGLGENAHTLSLFPGYDVILEKNHWVRAFWLEEEKIYRITLTAPVVNAADVIAFLVSGAEKAGALQHVLGEGYNPEKYPAQLVRPGHGKLYWWVDEAAAKNLTNRDRPVSTF